MARKLTIQGYPRKNNLLDASTLVAHKRKIKADELREIVLHAIKEANVKSSRAILEISEELGEDEIASRYRKSGKSLFEYFKKYCGDPASTAHQCFMRNYADVAMEQFRNWTLQ